MRESTKNSISSFLEILLILTGVLLLIFLFEGFGLSEYYYRGNLLKILAFQYPLFSVSNLTSMIVAAGTFALAIVAYLQMGQNKRSNEDKKKEKQERFDSRKKAIYLILIEKIGMDILFLFDMKLDPAANTNGGIVSYNDSFSKHIRSDDEYSLILNESEYFSLDVIQAIALYKTAKNFFINYYEESKNKNTPFTSHDISVELESNHNSAISKGITCWLSLIEDGDLLRQVNPKNNLLAGYMTYTDRGKEIAKQFKNGLKGDKLNFFEKLLEYKNEGDNNVSNL